MRTDNSQEQSQLEEKLRQLRERGDPSVALFVAYLNSRHRSAVNASLKGATVEAREQSRMTALAFESVIDKIAQDSMAAIKSTNQVKRSV